MKKQLKSWIFLLLISGLFLSLGPAKASVKPVRVARATWDTGWFQVEVFRQLIQELGYPIEKAKTVEGNRFYTQLGEGEFDFWPNGWLPGHLRFMSPYKNEITPVGYEVQSGALQGFMIDKKTADAYKITSFDDLKKPEIAKLFDHNGNQTADLIGCDLDWGCAQNIEALIQEAKAQKTVEQVQGNYSALMFEVLRLFRQGKPVLFYTWTPNWTVGELKPGEDMIWLPLNPINKTQKKQAIQDVEGCPVNPCFLGFAPSDIRVVANQHFLNRHPGIRKLFEQVRIPMTDISAQNARLLEGEDTLKDIEQHARNWISRHRVQIDQWLKLARQKMKKIPLTSGKTTELPINSIKVKKIKVAVKRFEPFITFEKLNYGGFGIELWRQIATQLDVPYEIVAVNSLAKLLDEVERGQVDLGISGIGMTSEREKQVDFSHPFYKSGLQIMVPQKEGHPAMRFMKQAFGVIFSPGLVLAILFLIVILFVAAHVMWWSERKNNPDFSPKYFKGIGEAVWWAAVTLTTVGYGDKTPRNAPGKVFALFWMFAGYFVFAYFTATVTSSMTLNQIEGSINAPSDLFNKEVATVRGSLAEDYLLGMGVHPTTYRDIDEAYIALKNKKAEAIVYHEPVLKYYATHEGQSWVKTVGPVFKKQNYGMIFQVNSPIQEKVNQALLKLIETGDYDRLYRKWFGEKS